VTADAFGNLCGSLRVFNEEMYFHFIGEVFLYSFYEFFEFIFDCTCALADQFRNAGMLQLAGT
jgi:hypothetical protein